MYQLIHKPTFTRHFIDLSKELQKRIVKDLEILEQSPNNAASKNIEHLGKKRELWSYRVNDNFRIPVCDSRTIRAVAGRGHARLHLRPGRWLQER